MVSETRDAVDGFLSTLTRRRTRRCCSPHSIPGSIGSAADRRPSCPSGAHGALTLYGLTPDAAAGRGLAEELLAAIGPSWSDFDGAAGRARPG